MSHAHAHENPAPAHAPLIAAIVTFPIPCSSCDVRIRLRRFAVASSTDDGP
jgi:hypothetical protein